MTSAMTPMRLSFFFTDGSFEEDGGLWWCRGSGAVDCLVDDFPRTGTG